MIPSRNGLQRATASHFAGRVARFLEWRGILERDEDNSHLTLDGLQLDPARADQRDKIERLYRYIARPTISEPRLSRTPTGNM